MDSSDEEFIQFNKNAVLVLDEEVDIGFKTNVGQVLSFQSMLMNNSYFDNEMDLFDFADIDDVRPWNMEIAREWKSGDELIWGMTRSAMESLDYFGRIKLMDLQESTTLLDHRNIYPTFLDGYETILTRQKRLKRDYMICYQYDHILLRQIYNGVCRVPTSVKSKVPENNGDEQNLTLPATEVELEQPALFLFTTVKRKWNQLLLPPGSHFDCTCDISLRCRDMLLDGVYHVGATGVKVVVLNGQMVSDDVFK